MAQKKPGLFARATIPPSGASSQTALSAIDTLDRVDSVFSHLVDTQNTKNPVLKDTQSPRPGS